MRISCEPMDKDYVNDPWNYLVTLNGQVVHNCVEACENMRQVKCTRYDGIAPVLNNGEFVYDTFTGDVLIERKSKYGSVF